MRIKIGTSPGLSFIPVILRRTFESSLHRMPNFESTAYLNIATPEEYERVAKDIFYFQYEHNVVYRAFCDLLHRSPVDVKNSFEIPALPIRFFKSHRVTTFDSQPAITFTSSGTTASEPAQHHLLSKQQYEQTFTRIFEKTYGACNQWAFLALLPAYLERQGSSLVYMMNHLINQSNHPDSGFYLDDFQALSACLKKLEAQQQPTLLIGVSFALLDFIEAFPQNLHYTTVMETGGMKGRREEITREALHQALSQGFKVKQIHSEYGMTELLSQAYSMGEGRFYAPPWMRVQTMEINDPFAPTGHHRVGRINIQDLANIHSCCFLATDDLGKTYPDGSFEVLGRMDRSDIRGCNLMAL